ncbi:MAG: hypothetical protein ACTSWX_02055 [Promethearchaeota archaeon]
MAKQQSLEKKIGIRIDEATLAKMEMILKKNQISKSNMVREAINIWLNINMNKKYNPDADLCIMSLNILKAALENVNDDCLIRMSKIAYNNHKITIKSVINDYQIIAERNEENINEENRDQFIEDRIKNLIEYVYDQSGYKWFDEITYTREGNNFIISGTHRLGDNFSRFIKYHLSNHLDEFRYQIEVARFETIEKKNTKENYIKFTCSPEKMK